MSNLSSTIRQLIVPVLFAAIAGVAVALLVGGVDIKGFGGKIGKSVSGLFNFFKPSPAEQGPASQDDYVAVYMENGKVYFGKMENSDTDEPKLTDVFSLNVTIQDQQRSAAESGEEGAIVDQFAPQTDFELVKLTDQFQAPTDLLVLSRNKILFWEPLKSDSRVVEAIRKYKAQQ
ncbi:hypothetical protein HYU89_00165 [Candidatus Collierbacteria bacterium]|nr:hypothetical protein [Candidatus Collierbacteria bacterium]